MTTMLRVVSLQVSWSLMVVKIIPVDMTHKARFIDKILYIGHVYFDAMSKQNRCWSSRRQCEESIPGQARLLKKNTPKITS